MNNSFIKTLKLLARNESSTNKTAQRQQVLAQIEATILREENQKVSEKSQKT